MWCLQMGLVHLTRCAPPPCVFEPSGLAQGLLLQLKARSTPQLLSRPMVTSGGHRHCQEMLEETRPLGRCRCWQHETLLMRL